MNESRDAWLAALRSRGDNARPREDCPAPESIWKAARLELPLDERVAIIDHVSECPVCAESWRLAAALGARHDAAAAPRRQRFLLPSNVKTWSLAAAAALVLAVGVTFMLRSSGPVVDPTTRTPDGEVLQPAIQDGASLPRDDFRLRWNAGPAGSRYDVVVAKPDLFVLVEARDLDSTEYRVPPEALAALPAGTPLLWRVVAHTPDGTTLSSRTLRAVVR